MESMVDKMIKVTLPDGTVLELPRGASAGDVAAAIGPGLAKAALGAEIDGRIVDLYHPIDGDVAIRMVLSCVRLPLLVC